MAFDRGQAVSHGQSSDGADYAKADPAMPNQHARGCGLPLASGLDLIAPAHHSAPIFTLRCLAARRR